MTEQEQIEIWRKEFERLQGRGFTALLENGLYEWSFTQERWEGFLMAKRSQPIVKLPKDYGNGKVEMGLVKKSLTAAGIWFEVED